MTDHGNSWSSTPLSRRTFLKGTAAGAAALSAAGTGTFAGKASSLRLVRRDPAFHDHQSACGFDQAAVRGLQ